MIRRFLLATCFVACVSLISRGEEAAKPVRVLIITGDHVSHAWEKTKGRRNRSYAIAASIPPTAPIMTALNNRRSPFKRSRIAIAINISVAGIRIHRVKLRIEHRP